MKSYRSHGKLLLTGEYVVLDGAVALAVPTKYGQTFEVEPINEPKIIWESLDEKGTVWFENEISLNQINRNFSSTHDILNRLIQILNTVKELSPNFLKTEQGFRVVTKLEFPKNWGLGTSSTLINNISQWANINAYKLLEDTFGGSGYDIACAQNDNAITYQLQKKEPIVKPVNFNPSFKEHLYFIHLNKKQNSREGIKHYKANKGHLATEITEINEITSKMITCNNLSDFEKLLIEHEHIISRITKEKPVKELLFNDFNGSVKSLGAWGGDFVLVASKENPKNYFKQKGFATIIDYEDMVL